MFDYSNNCEFRFHLTKAITCYVLTTDTPSQSQGMTYGICDKVALGHKFSCQL